MSEIESDDRSTEQRPRPVVVGYVEGATGDAALKAAAIEARLRGTTITVIHQLVGVEVPDRFGPDAGRMAMSGTGPMYHLLQMAEDAAPGLGHIDVRTVAGPIAEELILASKSAELVVLGVTTNHPSTAAVFDTVPRSVVRDSHCPVLLTGTTDWAVARVVCGIDRSPGSIDALRWAADDAARRGTTMLAVEVHPGRDVTRGQAEEDLSTWVRRCLPPRETTVLCATYSGSPAEVLTSVAMSQEALLVIGSHQPVPGHRLHSVARVVTAQTEVPVVIVPKPYQSHAWDTRQATAEPPPDNSSDPQSIQSPRAALSK